MSIGYLVYLYSTKIQGWRNFKNQLVLKLDKKLEVII